MHANSRLALGSAQFGLPYGIANRTGRVTPREVAKILDCASAHGMDTVDTAIDYAQSEATLGRAGVTGWHMVSKLPGLPEDVGDVEAWVRAQVSKSLGRLRVDRLYGLLLHRPVELVGPRGAALLGALLGVQRDGLVGKLGISIYDPEELDRLAGLAPLELVQAPMNVLDLRLLESGWAMKLKQLGAELHVRSAFLQGLLLMDAGDRPAQFQRWEPLWNRWAQWLAETGMSPLEACLRCVLGIPEVDRVVVGVDGMAQLQQILAVCGNALPSTGPWHMSAEPELIDPRLWSQA